VANPAPLRFTDIDGLYAALGGADADTVATAGEERLRRCLVAQWVCAHEHNLTQAADRGWAVRPQAALFWLDRLVGDGYTLSDAEATLRHDLTHSDDEDDAEDDEDDEQDDDTDADTETDEEPHDEGEDEPAVDESLTDD
jgi:ParB family chromosome partitioning protein